MSANNSRLIKLLVILCIAGGLWLLPVPDGVKPDAWHLMAIFIATVVGLILSPYPLGAMAMFSLTSVAILGLLPIKDVLAGFSDAARDKCDIKCEINGFVINYSM